ncbi:MAG: ribonuclease III family protein [Candidatus Bathyarchaeia archaeon]
MVETETDIRAPLQHLIKDKYSSIIEILNDRELASLGDAFINFIYSLALSKVAGRPIGRKLDSRLLSSALKKAGIRNLLPHRVDRHRQADAAEALIVYGWLSGAISIRETLDVLARNGETSDNICALLKIILERSGMH